VTGIAAVIVTEPHGERRHLRSGTAGPRSVPRRASSRSPSTASRCRRARGGAPRGGRPRLRSP